VIYNRLWKSDLDSRALNSIIEEGKVELGKANGNNDLNITITFSETLKKIQ